MTSSGELEEAESSQVMKVETTERPLDQTSNDESSSNESMSSELDEDDLDLLEHTLGNKQKRGFRNLQRRIASDDDEEEEKEDGMGDESSESEIKGPSVSGRKRKGEDLAKLFDEESADEDNKALLNDDDEEEDSGLDDFIEDDFGSDEEEVNKKVTRRTKEVHVSRDYSKMAGLTKDVIQDMLDIFGDGTEYADMIDDNLIGEMETLELDNKSKLAKKEEPTLLDCPERYDTIIPLRPGELEKEAIWISSQLLPFVKEKVETATIDILVPVVGSVLSLIRDQLAEIPFIATHRKEYFQHLLGLNDLWKILDFDEEWRSIWKQKESFLNFIQSKEPDYHATLSILLEDCESMEDFECIKDYHKNVLRFGNAGRTRAQNGDLYSHLIPLISSFCLEPKEFMMNWALKERKHEPPNPAEVDPSLLALKYVQEGSLPNEQIVLKKTKQLAAGILAYSPTTNKMFRTALLAVAGVTVNPTPLGQKEITNRHELAQFKYLSEKPIATFNDDLYLKLIKAETAGLLKVTVGFRRLGDLISEWVDYFAGFGGWSEVRKDILEMAIKEFLIPKMTLHVTLQLKSKAEQYISQACQFALQSKLMVAPFSAGPNGIISVSWAEGKPQDASMCVVLDSNGRVMDQAKFVHLQESGQRSDEEWSRFVDFIVNTCPSAIVVGGLSIKTVQLHDRLKATVRDNRLESSVKVVFGDDDVARLYQSSSKSQQEFPEYSPLLRYCVSLGRRWLCPLIELASLTLEEASRLNLHPSQQLLVPSSPALMKHILRAFINVTNLVGVDLSLALSNPWSRSPLKYVAGFGPRRVEMLLHQKPTFDQRVDLQQVLGKNIFMNSASFLCIGAGGSKKPIEPLDKTRIHPENYSLARKIACDAMEINLDEIVEEDAEDSCLLAINSVMKHPERLNDLLLDEYARELERRLNTPKHLTLLDIKAELQVPYADLRTVVADTPPEVVFESLTGETENSLFIGQVVPARVMKLTDRTAFCKLESGLNAVISLKNLPPNPDGRPASHPSKVLRPHQAIMACVIEIHLVHFEVSLSMLPEDLKEPRYPRLGDYDPYYDHEEAKSIKKSRRGFSDSAESVTKNRSSTEHLTKTSTRRLISHPSYKDVSRQEAERLLSSAILGEVIIRPSGSFGKDHLTLTWKVDQCDQGGLFQHVDIEEKDRATEFSLGSKLIITIADGSKQNYEDLDEIIARFVEPMSAYLQDTRNCPKFLSINSLDRTGSRTTIESWLANERSKAPGRIAYCLSLSREKPGSVLLSYQPSNRPHHELIDVTPSGFRLRATTFDRLEALINWFKQNYSRR